jgi:regulator of protease activity HflC (stomatin/prohibitin superfamily)
MFIIRKLHIKSYERGIYFRDGEVASVLQPGTHWIWYRTGRDRIDIMSQREPWITSDNLDVIVKSGKVAAEATILDLRDNQRALVWIDGRFNRVLSQGLYAFWNGYRDVRVEIITADSLRFVHADIEVILKNTFADASIESLTVEPGFVAVYFANGRYVETLAPGRYAFWKNLGKVKVQVVDMREVVLDIAGQEIMTADKVTLRMNAVVNFKVADAVAAVQSIDDYRQAVYREAQLALRAYVGTRPLDDFLADKTGCARDLLAALGRCTGKFGVDVVGFGIRDIILPGEMKELLNKVTEAKKAAEANLVVRREETAAIRNQMNTAKLLEENPTLMRLRELEVLENVAKTANLKIVLGETGLKERLLNLV